MVEVKQRGTGSVIHVHEDHLEFWLERGFVKVEDDKPAPVAKKAATRRSSSKK